jgi:O-antigen ligase
MERKQNPSASWAIWIPTLWLLKVQTIDLAYWIGKGDEEGAGSPYEKYFLVLLLCLGLLILYRRRLVLYEAVKDNAWLAVLIGYMFLSIFWSDTPFTSFKRWTREFIVVIMALVILSEADPREAMQSLLKRSIYAMIPLSILVVLFFPEIGIKAYTGEVESWRGITGGKNQLGRVCFITASFLVWAIVADWKNRYLPIIRQQIWVDVIILGITLFLLKGPGIGKMLSITSLVTLFLGLGTFFGFLWMKRLKRVIGIKTLKVVIAACIVLGTASVFVGGLVVGESITEAVGREATLTGRVEIWGKFLPLALEEPLVGHGVGGFWTEKLTKVERLNQAHNGYLDILLDYGFVGLLLFSLFLLSSCQKAHKELSHDYNWGSIWIGFLVMGVIYSFTEATIDTFTVDLTAILVFLYVIPIKATDNLHDEKPT